MVELDSRTSMNVWPTLKVRGLPSASSNVVGEVRELFCQVPLTVRPFVEIQADPRPITWASRRFFVEPSLSGANDTTMITTLLGATTWPSAASRSGEAPETDR